MIAFARRDILGVFNQSAAILTSTQFAEKKGHVLETFVPVTMNHFSFCSDYKYLSSDMCAPKIFVPRLLSFFS